MFNFWTKKQKEKILERKGEVQNYLDNTTQEEKSALQQAAINTQNQNFTAAEYNEQARKNGEENWQTAYRNDILGIKDQETEIQKKHRLYNEEKARQETEYQKRIAENPETALPGDNTQITQNTSPQPSPGGDGVNNNIPKIENDSRVTVENKQTETTQNGEQTNQSSHLASTPEGDGKNENIDYQNWNVEGWKSRGSSKEELENAVEKKYGTVASWKEDGSLEAVINGEKFSWKIDSNGNPVKTSLGNANQVDINKGQVFQMIQNGNTASEINDYIHKNNLQDDPDVKNQLKQKYISDYEKPILQKYRNLSLQDLHKAVKNGEILPGTEVFNKLPQAEAYNKYQKSFAIIDARKEADFSAVNSAIEIEKIVEKSVSKFFDTKGIEDVTERWKNDPEIKQYRADVYESQKKIIEYRRQMKDIGDEVRKQMGGAPESMIMAEISKRAENIYRGIETETALMNASLGMIGDRKGDFEVEMKMLGYKDGLKKEQYMSALSLYKDITQRQDKEKYYKMDQEWEKEKFKLQEESNKIAREHNHQLQKSIILFQNEIRKGQGNFVTHPNGVYFQKNDGTIELVMKGEDLGIIPDSDYNITPYKRDDGGVTYAYFNKKTNEMGVYSLDAFGNELSEYSETGTDFKKYAKYYPNDAGPKNNNPSGITWNGGFDNPRPGTTAQLLLDNGIVYKKGRPRPSREGGYYVAFDSAEDGIKAHYLTLAVSKQTVRQRLKDWVGVGNMEEYARSVFGNSGLDLKLLDTPLNKLTPQQLNKLMIAQIGRESPGFLKSMIKEGMIKDGKIVLTPKKQEKVIKPMDKTQFDQSRNLINDFRNDKAVATFNSALDSAKDLLTSLGDGSGAGDMSAIFQFMKTLDPSSVVRESEFELAGKTSGTTEQWGLIFNKLQTGESLTENQRKNFKKLAIQYIINKSEAYNEVYKSYSDRYKFQLGEDYYNLNFPKNRALEFNQKYNPLYIKAQQEVANMKAKKEAEENLKKGFNKVLEHGKDFYEKFKNNYK